MFLDSDIVAFLATIPIYRKYKFMQVSLKVKTLNFIHTIKINILRTRIQIITVNSVGILRYLINFFLNSGL
jgi:hypothetical protein